jgi:pimeloyl-ACP methyl ester carboxylesterase
VNRRWAVLLGVVLLAACSTPAAPPTAPQPSTPTAPAALGTNGAAVPELRWNPCHQTFQCATATVPMNYREPSASPLSLSVIKLPATDPGRRLGSLFVNFGGPGTDGVGELLHFGPKYPEELRARFDLVSFDPRGIGASSPIACPSTPSPPAGSPLRPDQRDTFYATSAAPGKACTGELLKHVSTANVARDMDLLRQAVGEQSLNFLGYSYGTYLGATYANLFPGTVRAMTLDGTLDLVANAAGAPGQENAPVDVRADVAGAQLAELNSFFDECVKAKCAFSAGDPRQKFAEIMARLSHGPIGATTTASLLKTIDSAFYQVGRWKRLGETLNALAGSSRGAVATPVLDPFLATHSAGFLAVQCVDSELPQDRAVYEKLADGEAQRVPYFGLGAVFSMAQCLGWPARDEDRYLGPWDAPRANPVLIVNSRYDPATPLHNAEAAAKQLGNAALLVVDGWGHTSLNVHSACASAAMTSYFTTLATPAPGARCAPDAFPFTP